MVLVQREWLVLGGIGLRVYHLEVYRLGGCGFAGVLHVWFAGFFDLAILSVRRLFCTAALKCVVE